MRQRIQNNLIISCTGVDLTTVQDLKFYMKQDIIFEEYTPKVISASQMQVVIPQANAMKLDINEPVRLQFAFRYSDGSPGASEVEDVLVSEFLKEAGYDPV